MRYLALVLMLWLTPMLFSQQPSTPKPPATPQQQIDNLQGRFNNYANLRRYAEDNAKLEPAVPGRVVFLGDSITDIWGRGTGSFFPGKPYVNRGIGGQTTSQMVLRFQQDVVQLQPAAVVLLAGTNDIAENTGPINDLQIQDNFRAIVDMALAAHIRVILGSIPPADRFPWHPGIEPAARIRALNAWLKSYADRNHLVYLDYYTAMATPEGAMKPDLATDKYVHPNAAGYAIMQPLAEAAITKALAQPAP